MSLNTFFRGVGVGLGIAACLVFAVVPQEDVMVDIPQGFKGQVYRTFVVSPSFGHSPNVKLLKADSDMQVLDASFKESVNAKGQKGVEVMVLLKQRRKNIFI